MPDRHASGEGGVTLEIDGRRVTVPAGSTILEACGGRAGAIPTLCYGETITPKNACRVCMVEVEGSRPTWWCAPGRPASTTPGGWCSSSSTPRSTSR
jgi:NADH dehydrogenase/NADH:ubiquinone oxidoreductase subunit G